MDVLTLLSGRRRSLDNAKCVYATSSRARNLLHTGTLQAYCATCMLDTGQVIRIGKVDSSKTQSVALTDESSPSGPLVRRLMSSSIGTP